MFDAQNTENIWPKFRDTIRHKPYVYFCRECVRSFYSQDFTDRCRFCGRGVEELRDELLNKVVKRWKFHYYCEECKKDFIVHDKRKFCDCGMPVKRLTILEKYGIKQQLKDIFPVIRKLGIKRPLEKGGSKPVKNKRKALVNRFYALKRIKTPHLSFYRRHKEELPTDYTKSENMHE